MKVKHLVLEALLIAMILAAPPCMAQQLRPAPATLEVRLPPAAELFFDGAPTRQRGPVRRFVTPPLEPGWSHTYKITARWKSSEGKDRDESRDVNVLAGKLTKVDLPFWLTLKQAAEFEKKNALPITEFYDTPDLRKTKPGALIRFDEEFAGYDFPSAYAPALKPKDIGIKAVRFLYHSKSALGGDVPASGVILIPYGKAPKTGWPVVVWAHGTSGVGRQFAPSLMRDLYYSWEGLLQWAMLGYAVVAPDYAGLGTDVRHQYLTPPAQAQDIINAVPAARKAVKELGEKWIAIGHSQGGAVIAVAEMQNKIKDPGYLGAIALAPVGDLEPFLEQVNNSENRGYCAFLAYGIKSVYPDFEYGDFLTPEAAKLMPVVEKGGWGVTLATFAHDVPIGKVLKPDWKENKHFQKFRKLTKLGEKPAYGPVLLIQGEADETIPTESTNDLYERMQKQNPMVEYQKYDGLDHDPLVFGSFRDQLRWVQDRFDGKPVANKKQQ